MLGRSLTLQVWDVDKRYCTHSFRGHDGVIVRVEFVPDAQRLQLVSCSEDNSIRVWDLRGQKCVATFKDHFRYGTRDAAWRVCASIDCIFVVALLEMGEEW